MSRIALACAAEPRASIVILGTAALERTRACLSAVAAVAPDVAFETIVMLEGASVEHGAQLAASLEGVCVEASPAGVGLGASLNRARERCRGEYLVMLHDDAIVRAGWLEALVSAADSDPGAGAIGSASVGRDGRVRAAGSTLERDGTTHPRWLGDRPLLTELQRVDAVDYSGTYSLLVRAATWDRVGGADERFLPLCYVDVDLCLAIRARGERVVVEPRSVVVHEGGTSATPELATFAALRNRAALLEKWGELVTAHNPGLGAVYDLPPDALPRQERERDPALALQRSVALLRDHAAELAARVRALESESVALRYEVAALRPRAETLAAIEAGGWWRLRGRLLPLLAPYRRLRRDRHDRRG